MERRNFIKGAAATGAAAAAVAVSSFPKPAIAQGKKQLKMVTSWPKNFPGLGTAANRIAASIKAMSGGKYTVKVFAGGELVHPLKCNDAVQQGHRRHVPLRRLLLWRQGQGLPLLHRGAVRFYRQRDRRLDPLGRRPEAVGRGRCSVRHQAPRRRQYRVADGRLVQEDDQFGRGLQGPQDAYSRASAVRCSTPSAAPR